jgi:gliding motility-associated lipoprotein GldH
MYYKVQGTRDRRQDPEYSLNFLHFRVKLTIYLCAMKSLKSLLLYLVPCTLCLAACTTVDLYEKTASIPGHSWKSSYQPSFDFTIKDTASLYQLYFIIRHNDKYSFNNIYIDLITKQPGQDSTLTARYDLKLATDNEGWLASGMDDIYEHRIPLTSPGRGVRFPKPGDYEFSIQQIMRENPLNNVLNVGLRIEKK